jgi:hypothetical protein
MTNTRKIYYDPRVNHPHNCGLVNGLGCQLYTQQEQKGETQEGVVKDCDFLCYNNWKTFLIESSINAI